MATGSRPTAGQRPEQAGEDIVQLGTAPGGSKIRWSFSEITPDSFRWRGEVSSDGGATWRLNVEFLARRKSG
jgi:hypothetical protein